MLKSKFWTFSSMKQDFGTQVLASSASVPLKPLPLPALHPAYPTLDTLETTKSISHFSTEFNIKNKSLRCSETLWTLVIHLCYRFQTQNIICPPFFRSTHILLLPACVCYGIPAHNCFSAPVWSFPTSGLLIHFERWGKSLGWLLSHRSALYLRRLTLHQIDQQTMQT